MRSVFFRTIGLCPSFTRNFQKISKPISTTSLRDFSYYNSSPSLGANSVPGTGQYITTQRFYCSCILKSHRGIIFNDSLYNSPYSYKKCSTNAGSEKQEQEKKPSLYQRFKTMYKEYWYVLLPVHLVTSAGWFGGFYYMASSGFDIVALLEWLNINDKLVEPFRNGHAKTGYLAIAYALYKVATPLRYTVTLGGTTISINYLKKWGVIKPVPSTEKLKEMYQDKKGQIMEKGQTLKENVMKSLKPTESKKKSP